MRYLPVIPVLGGGDRKIPRTSQSQSSRFSEKNDSKNKIDTD